MARGKQKLRKSPRDLKNPFRRGSILPVSQLHNYSIIKRIGRGSFGAVYKVEKAGKIRALKLVNLRQVCKERFEKECEVTKLFSERFAGPLFVDSWSLAKKEVGVIVMDLWDTTLGEYMDSSSRKSVPKVVVQKIQGQLDRLHFFGMSHFDVHADNIFLKVTREGTICDATLGDFGHTTATSALDSKRLKEIIEFYNLPKKTAASNVDQLQFNQVKHEWK